VAVAAVTAAVAVAAPGAWAAAAAPTGPDVSGWQHTAPLSWPVVKASGQSFVFLKATEGRSFVNTYFTGDWAAARRAGLMRGAYHFARPSVGSGVTQARRFVAVAGTANQPGDLPPVLDLEVTGGLKPAQLSAWTQQFLQEVNRLTGRTPMIYTYPAFWRQAMGNTTAFTGYPLWIASYRPAPAVPAWPRWRFWQYTANGTVAGIAGHTVDMNRYNGDLGSLRRLANLDPRARVTISAVLSARTASPGDAVTLRGTVNPVLKGRTVYRQGFYSGAWHTWATTKVHASGSFSFTIRPKNKAVNTYRVYLPGSATHQPATSASLVLTVR
jgi:lysozyme